jgi:hypothetical protein
MRHIIPIKDQNSDLGSVTDLNYFDKNNLNTQFGYNFKTKFF